MQRPVLILINTEFHFMSLPTRFLLANHHLLSQTDELAEATASLLKELRCPRTQVLSTLCVGL